jgi:hypothetical protein
MSAIQEPLVYFVITQFDINFNIMLKRMGSKDIFGTFLKLFRPVFLNRRVLEDFERVVDIFQETKKSWF